MARVRVPGVVGGVIKGGGVLDDIAEFIRNPPTSPVGGAIGRAGQKFCDYLSASPALAFGILQVQGVIGSIVCEPYFDDSGNSPPEPGPPPFLGGQCDGLLYRPTGTYIHSCDSTSFPIGTTSTWIASGNCIGPITGVTLSSDGGTWIIQHAGATQRFVASQVVSSSVQNVPRTGVECAQLTLAARPSAATQPPAITSVNPVGHSDECGDPEGEPIPGPTPAPLPPDYQPGIDFGLDDDGQPFFDVPGVENPFGDPIPFDDPFTPLPSTPTPPQPTGDNSPGESDAVGNPIGDGVAGDMGEDFDFGEPPLGKIWVGCLVEFSVDNAYGNIPNTGPENTVYPLTVGNVSLRYGNLRGTSHQVRSRFTELFRPNTALEVTGVFVQTRPNTSSIVRPISVTVCKETQCFGE